MRTGCPVLVVEDDEDIRDVLAALLHEFGYSVIIAKNGAEALQRLRSGTCRPCVILLDLWMPVMNGWEFREEQRKDSSLAAIPVVALSGDGEAREFDAAAHLRKPIQFNPLVSTVERFCGPGEIGSERARGALVDASRSETPEERAAAVASLVAIDDPVASRRLVELITDPDPTVALAAIARPPDDPAADRALAAVIGNSSAPFEVRLQAVQRYVARGGQLDPATEAMIDGLRGEQVIEEPEAGPPDAE